MFDRAIFKLRVFDDASIARRREDITDAVECFDHTSASSSHFPRLHARCVTAPLCIAPPVAESVTLAGQPLDEVRRGGPLIRLPPMTASHPTFKGLWQP